MVSNTTLYPPPYTLYKYINGTYSHRDGGRRVVVNQREGERGNK